MAEYNLHAEPPTLSHCLREIILAALRTPRACERPGLEDKPLSPCLFPPWLELYFFIFCVFFIFFPCGHYVYLNLTSKHTSDQCKQRAFLSFFCFYFCNTTCASLVRCCACERWTVLGVLHMQGLSLFSVQMCALDGTMALMIQWQRSISILEGKSVHRWHKWWSQTARFPRADVLTIIKNSTHIYSLTLPLFFPKTWSTMQLFRLW